jgi:hypothetical protein
MTDLYDGPTTQLVTTCATCKFWHTLKPGSPKHPLYCRDDQRLQEYVA